MMIRAALPGDAPAIAMLHANSWRSAYRGILRDEFLDGALDGNRRALWGYRLSDKTPNNQIILVDEEAGQIRGFAVRSSMRIQSGGRCSITCTSYLN